MSETEDPVRATLELLQEEEELTRRVLTAKEDRKVIMRSDDNIRKLLKRIDRRSQSYLLKESLDPETLGCEEQLTTRIKESLGKSLYDFFVADQYHSPSALENIHRRE